MNERISNNNHLIGKLPKTIASMIVFSLPSRYYSLFRGSLAHCALLSGGDEEAEEGDEAWSGAGAGGMRSDAILAEQAKRRAEAEARRAAGDWVHIFPEGTRSRDGRMGPVRKGVGRLVASCAAASFARSSQSDSSGRHCSSIASRSATSVSSEHTPKPR